MIKDFRIYIEDMLDAVEKIEMYTVGVDELQFSENYQLQDAIIRRLGIIGEAAKKLPPEIQLKIPAVPWKSVIGLRNIVIHDYSNISLDKIWEVLKTDLPKLKTELDQLLKSLVDK